MYLLLRRCLKQPPILYDLEKTNLVELARVICIFIQITQSVVRTENSVGNKIHC